MVIVKTPLRISFFGGGTDYPAWFKMYGGAVLSTTIDQYAYLSIHPFKPFFPYKSKVVWSRIEEVNSIEDIVHPAVRETLRFFNLSDGLSIHYDGDLPARSGMGSSSSFTVGLVHALHALAGRNPDKKQLAEEAIHIEQNCIKENVGSQDQIAAAYGGFNIIHFFSDGSFNVEHVKLPQEKLAMLQGHLLLFFTGFSRTASEITIEQIDNIPHKIRELRSMRAMVDDAMAILQGDGDWLGRFGTLLHKSWEIKRTLSSKISNQTIDGYYSRALEAGALGGKVLGAGGGGFILIFARPENHESIKCALSPLLHIPFAFEQKGSQIMYRSTDHAQSESMMPFNSIVDRTKTQI